MLKNRLTNLLNSHIGLQVVLSLLPAFLIVVYICVYVADIGNVYSVLKFNDLITEEEIINDSLKEVVSYNQNPDGSYNVTVKGSDSVPVDVKSGDLLFSLSIISEDWLVLHIGDERLYSISSDLVTKIEKVNDKFRVYVAEQYFDVDKNRVIAEVYIDEQGYFEIRYPSEDIEPIKAEYLSNVELLLSSDKTTRYNIASSYSSDISDYNINFVTNLPTDNVYFSEQNYSLVRNISTDFASNIIFGSNIFVVIVSMLGYCALLGIVKREGKLSIMCRKEPLVINFCFISLLVACIPFTYFMLG